MAEFKKVLSVKFSETDGKHYSIEITSINGTPYVNMAAYVMGKDTNWLQDRKKNYFMTVDVFSNLFAMWPEVSSQILEKLKSCMFFYLTNFPL